MDEESEIERGGERKYALEIDIGTAPGSMEVERERSGCTVLSL